MNLRLCGRAPAPLVKWIICPSVTAVLLSCVARRPPEALHSYQQHKPDSDAWLSGTCRTRASRHWDRARWTRDRVMTAELWDRETFVEKLRAIGVRAYHD